MSDTTPPPFPQPANSPQPVPPSGPWVPPPTGPPPGGQQPMVYGQTMAGVGPATPDIGNAFSWMINAVQRFFGPVCGVGATMVALAIIPAVLGVFAWFALLAFSGAMDTNEFGQSASPNLVVIVLAYLVFFLFTQVASMLAQGLGMGAAKVAADGERPGVGAAFRAVPWLRFMATAALLAGLMLVGLVLCFLPGFVVGWVAPFALMQVVDGDATPGEAIARTWTAVTAHPVPILLGGFVASFLSGAGAMACYIGLIVSMPAASFFLLFLFRGVNNRTITYWPAK